jgi:DNA-directed RNA polymerase specialized sigma24 family protein
MAQRREKRALKSPYLSDGTLFREGEPTMKRKANRHTAADQAKDQTPEPHHSSVYYDHEHRLYHDEHDVPQPHVAHGGNIEQSGHEHHDHKGDHNTYAEDAHHQYEGGATNRPHQPDDDHPITGSEPAGTMMESATDIVTDAVAVPHEGSLGGAIIDLWKLVHGRVRNSSDALQIIDDTLYYAGPYITRWVEKHKSISSLDPYFILRVGEARIKRYREKRRHASLEKLTGAGLDIRSAEADLADQVEARGRLLSGLSHLNPAQQLALFLEYPQYIVYLHEVSLADTARLMNKTEKGVYQTRYVAKKKLKAALASYDRDEEDEHGAHQG